MMFKVASPCVAIAGGGCSGVLVLHNLVEQAAGSLRIYLFEQSENLAEGVAYRTDETAHRLNVPAGRMGARAGRPDDFWLWLQSEQGRSESQRLCSGEAIDAGRFLPRKLYRSYLKALLGEALAKAKEKSIEVNIVHRQLSDASFAADGLRVRADGDEYGVQALVLATGNESPAPFFSGDHPAYVNDLWQAGRLRAALAGVSNKISQEIVVIGTGLTAVDAVLSLESLGYRGKITALSRHGWLPAAHEGFAPYGRWEWTADPASAPRTALGMLRRLRAQVKHAAKLGHDWRSVIDSLRPVTAILWRQLPVDEQKRFLRRLFGLWNVHRHRMAPEIACELKKLADAGRFRVAAGRIHAIAEQDGRLQVRFGAKGGEETVIDANLVINCAGPGWRLSQSRNMLLSGLLKKGMIAEHRLGLGLRMDGMAAAGSKGVIFPIGPLMLGEYLESVAVPELREQAFTVAKNVLQRLQGADDVKERAWL